MDETGAWVRMAHQVDEPVDGDIVSFLARLLGNAGFLIVEQYGDWDRSRLTETSPEIITVARRRR